MTKLSSPFPPYILPHTRTQNGGGAASADVIQSLAGVCTSLAQHTVGPDVVSDANQGAPRNPSGDYGHDHSGGWYGRGLFESIATLTFDDFESLSSSRIFGNDNPVNLFTPTGGANEDNESVQSVIFGIEIPPCAPGGAFENLGISLVGDYDAPTGTMQSDDVVYVDLRPLHRRWNDAGEINAERLTLGAPQTVGVAKFLTNHGDAGADFLIPGAINMFEVKLVCQRSATAGTRQPRLQLREIEFGVFTP